MRTGDEIYSAWHFIEAFAKIFQNEDMEDLPASVVTMLCAFNAMNSEDRKTFLLHLKDCYCLECTEADCRC